MQDLQQGGHIARTRVGRALPTVGRQCPRHRGFSPLCQRRRLTEVSGGASPAVGLSDGICSMVRDVGFEHALLVQTFGLNDQRFGLFGPAL